MSTVVIDGRGDQQSTAIFLPSATAIFLQPDEVWKNKLSPDQYYVLRMVSC